jgi:hypothetical protein
MRDLQLNSGPPINGLRTTVLENSLVHLVLLPEAGARIWQITYKPLNAELLWNKPHSLPTRQPLHASYDDTWCGGWDDLFPNDEAGPLNGHALPDHGELWTGEWEQQSFKDADGVGVHLQFTTPITNFLAEKSVRLRDHNAVIEVHYRLTNKGRETLPFLWKLHPAFAVSASHRIDFPPMTVRRELDFPGTLDGAPPVFPWPHALQGNGAVDLRQVPDVSSRAVHFFYGTDYKQGWCGITNRTNHLAAGLCFDPKVFSSCWLFATYGGWRDLNVAVLEPATGYPFRIQSMIDCGQARVLAPGESLETTVLFSIQPGLSSIGGIEADGRILPGDDN